MKPLRTAFARSVRASVCAIALCACGAEDDDGSCPPLDELMQPTSFTLIGSSTRIDSNSNPNDLESSTFADLNQDGLFDLADTLDYDMDGVPDDFNGDGMPDNKFLFNDQGARIPDADSFDDYEEVDWQTNTVTIPRATLPVSETCAADGIATGPLEVSGQNGRPMFQSWRPSRCCLRTEAP